MFKTIEAIRAALMRAAATVGIRGEPTSSAGQRRVSGMLDAVKRGSLSPANDAAVDRPVTSTSLLPDAIHRTQGGTEGQPGSATQSSRPVLLVLPVQPRIGEVQLPEGQDC